MMNIAESGEQTSFSLSSATVFKFKPILAENYLPTMRKKYQLQERAVYHLGMKDLLHAIEAAAFIILKIPDAANFGDLLKSG